MELTTIIQWVLSAITGVAGWLVGRRKRDNDFIADMQNSIKKLTSDNDGLIAKLLELKKQNVELLANQDKMTKQIEQLKDENKSLKDELQQLNDKLSNVKTITRHSR